MNIYEIDQSIMALVDPETGEIMDWDAFDQLKMDREEKIENVACWCKNLMAEASAIRQEELNLQKRRQAVESMAETRKRWLEKVLCGQKFETAKCSVSFRKTTKVEVEDTAAAIQWAEIAGYKDCVSYKAPDVNKNGLAKLLKEGIEIPGVSLVEGMSMGVK